MVNAMDCWIVVSKFELQLLYYVQFQTNTLEKGMNPLILPAMSEIVPLLFFWKVSFGIEQPRKVDMPLNKETKPYDLRYRLPNEDEHSWVKIRNNLG